MSYMVDVAGLEHGHTPSSFHLLCHYVVLRSCRCRCCCCRDWKQCINEMPPLENPHQPVLSHLSQSHAPVASSRHVPPTLHASRSSSLSTSRYNQHRRTHAEENRPGQYHNAVEDWLAGYISPAKLSAGNQCEILQMKELLPGLAYSSPLFQTVQIQVYWVRNTCKYNGMSTGINTMLCIITGLNCYTLRTQKHSLYIKPFCANNVFWKKT